MSRSHQRPMTKIPTDAAVTFYEQLKFVLEHYRDPARLGEASALAQPYFLGPALHNNRDATTNFGRGILLCEALEKTVITLWEGPLPPDQATLLQIALQAKEERGFCDQYYYLLLDLTYFHTYFPPPSKQSEIYAKVLHVSRATYDRHLREAMRRFGELLLLRLQPTLHVEQPTVGMTLIGRRMLRKECLLALEGGKSVYLCGPSGIGKTAIGITLTEQWPNPAIFWFTIRVTLNDQLASLLFALGNFLHQQGASRLWLQLIADAGVMKDPNLALELARADLAALTTPALLCFDEIDLLRPLDIETETVQHTQFLAFVEGLQNHSSLLLMGQRTVLPTDSIYTLPCLTTIELATWLTQADVDFTPSLLDNLEVHTGGNPRLVALCLALYRTMPTQTIESFRQVLDQLPKTPALVPIWQRLQIRLKKSEQRMLQMLSVFRSAAPRDAWPDPLWEDEPASASKTNHPLARLIAYQLVQEDGSGGITLLPALRNVIYNQLTVEKREDLHLQAGTIRATRGEYTAAAYHYHAAGQPELAISTWSANAEQEIRRGQATATLAIFVQISCHRLPDDAAQALRLLRSRLYQLGGQSAQALAEVEPTQILSDEWRVDAARVGGDALRTLGETDKALTRYGDGLGAAARLLQQNIWLRAKRGTVHLQQRELHNARREALYGRYCLENLEGAIQETTGNYSIARQHYLQALEAAELLDDKVGLALVQRNLGVLAAHQADEENAIRYHQQALAFYEKIGDRVSAEEVRSNLVGVYVQFKAFIAAIEPAQQALTFFTAHKNSYWIAQNTSNLATVYYELGDFAQAKQYAEYTLEQEEPQSYPYALFTLGQIHQAQRQWAEATAHFDRVRQIAEQTQDHFLLEQLALLIEDRQQQAV